MASVLHSVCCCFTRPRTPKQSQLDERTALLDDHLPEVPQATLSADIQQQLADQAAAREVVDEASERIINVQSRAPFSHLRIPSPSANQLSTSPTWRAMGNSRSPGRPAPHDVRQLRLGFEGTTHFRGRSAKISPRHSVHSLKTLPRTYDEDRATAFSAIRNHEHVSVDHDVSKDYGTMASYRTASEGPSLRGMNEDDGSRSRRCTKRPPFIDMHWRRDESVTENGHSQQHSTVSDSQEHIDLDRETGDELESEPLILDHPDCLTDDPDKLRELIDSGFKLNDTGPLFVSL